MRPPEGQPWRKRGVGSERRFKDALIETVEDLMRGLNREPRALGCLWLFTLFWNGLIVWGLIYWRPLSPLDLPFFAFQLLFFGIGIWLLMLCVLPLVVWTKLERAEISVYPPKVRPGETFSITYRQRIKRDIFVNRMVARFIFRESATYSQGTSEATDSQDWILDERELLSRIPFRGGTILQQTFEFTVPKRAMHTFVAQHNKLQYLVTFDMEIERWADYHDIVEVTVLSELPEGNGSENGS